MDFLHLIGPICPPLHPEICTCLAAIIVSNCFPNQVIIRLTLGRSAIPLFIFLLKNALSNVKILIISPLKAYLLIPRRSLPLQNSLSTSTSDARTANISCATLAINGNRNSFAAHQFKSQLG